MLVTRDTRFPVRREASLRRISPVGRSMVRAGTLGLEGDEKMYESDAVCTLMSRKGSAMVATANDDGGERTDSGVWTSYLHPVWFGANAHKKKPSGTVVNFVQFVLEMLKLAVSIASLSASKLTFLAANNRRGMCCNLPDRHSFQGSTSQSWLGG